MLETVAAETYIQLCCELISVRVKNVLAMPLVVVVCLSFPQIFQ